MKLRHGCLILGLLTGLMTISCDDDETATIITKDNWIGNACTCTGAGCAIFEVPLPVPDLSIGPAEVKGCENVEANIEGAVSVCLRTIPKEMATTAPPVYFPDGYCTLSAVGCTGDAGMCEIASYGDVDKMTSCPKGTTLLESVFDYSLMGKQTVITNKICAKNCETNADCNEAGEVECIEKDNAKFCYNRKNFEFMNRGYSVKQFN